MATRGEAHRVGRDQHGEPVAFGCDTAGSAAGASMAVGAEPVAGRYRLDDRVSETGPSTVWKAFDHVLERAVTVRTFTSGSACGANVVAAARAACQVPDHRLERVFDADAVVGGGYVVTEWPDGDCLDDMLATGYLDVTWVTRIIAEAASALAAAHAAGIAHANLTLRSLRWSRDAGLKITGLGIEAALAAPAATESVNGGSVSADQARADTRALARLLYALLTGHWPGGRHALLPPAPQRDSHPYRPRQVRAGVPARIDQITCRALFEPVTGDGQPVTSPGQLADLLNAALTDNTRPATAVAAPDDTEALRGWEAPPPGGHRPAQPRRRRRHALAGGLVGALFVIDSALIGVSIMGAGNAPHVAQGVAQTPRSVVPSHRPARQLAPVSARGFDPYGAGDENNELAPAAIDGNSASAWHTFWYTTPRFGNLKPGTGLLLDLGGPATITRARLLLGASTGADVELRIGDRVTSLSDLPVAAAKDNAGRRVVMRPASPHRGRYVLIWFTKLPPRGDGSGVFQADVHDVGVRGF